MTETLIIAIIGSGAFSALISGAFTMAAAKKKKDNGVTAGTRMILYDRIKHLGKKYIASGFIETEDLEDIIEMHRIYHDDLGGNGYLDSVMAAVKKLPIR